MSFARSSSRTGSSSSRSSGYKSSSFGKCSSAYRLRKSPTHAIVVPKGSSSSCPTLQMKSSIISESRSYSSFVTVTRCSSSFRYTSSDNNSCTSINHGTEPSGNGYASARQLPVGLQISSTEGCSETEVLGRLSPTGRRSIGTGNTFGIVCMGLNIVFYPLLSQASYSACVRTR